MGISIDRCFCFSKTFSELAEVARSTGAATVPELQEHALFGQKCQLCHPYARRMLRTGQTVFHEIVTDADEPVRSTPPSEAHHRAGDGGSPAR